MKKIVIIILLLLFIPLFAYLGYLYMAFEGTPWGKMEAKKVFETYLVDKFSTEIRIKKVQYNPIGKHYFARCISNDRNIEFKVYYWDDILIDNYYIYLWEDEINRKLKSIHSYNNATISSHVSIFPSNEAKLFEKHGKDFKKIPSFFSVRDDVGNKIWIYINLSYDFTNGRDESEKIFKLFTKTRETLKFESLSLHYKNRDFHINDTELQIINSAEELEKYFERGA